jgi:hypothetical protein
VDDDELKGDADRPPFNEEESYRVPKQTIDDIEANGTLSTEMLVPRMKKLVDVASGDQVV